MLIRVLGVLIVSTFALSGCTTKTPPRVYEDVIEITEINPNRLTALTKQNLFHLAKVYDLKPFLFTKKINVQSYVVPHSHPVLTLNTRNAEKPHQLLATWLHEEFHWWVSSHRKETDRAITQLRRAFPKIPAGGALNVRSNYLHLVICYLEYRALEHYLGKKDAREVINHLVRKDKLYPWIYTQVLRKGNMIKRIVQKNNLLPPPLT